MGRLLIDGATLYGAAGGRGRGVITPGLLANYGSDRATTDWVGHKNSQEHGQEMSSHSHADKMARWSYYFKEIATEALLSGGYASSRARFWTHHDESVA